LILALEVCVLSAGCLAAGPPGPAPVPELRALLATSTNVLSETAMAGQKGSGLRPPAVITNEASGPPRVLLWDEMRLGPLLSPPPDGVVTGGVGGK
jgi:hypothetical protein